MNDLNWLVADEHSRIKRSFQLQIEDNRNRLALLELVRALDWCGYTNQAAKSVATPEEGKPELFEEYLAFGWNRSLSLFMDEEVYGLGAPFFNSQDHLHVWANSAAYQCGRAEMFRLFLDYEKAGLAQLSEEEDGCLHLRFKTKWVALEAHEKEYFDQFPSFIIQKNRDRYDQIHRKRNSVRKLMLSQVHVSLGNSIGYHASEEVSAVYKEFGRLQIELLFGTDAFPLNSIFGGIQYRRYLEVLSLLMGWSYCHCDYMALLVNKQPHVNPLDALTITASEWTLAEMVEDALDVTFSDARQIVKAFVLHPDNLRCHTAGVRMARPPLIQIGHGFVVRSIGGCLGEPQFFLLRELKRLYPDDYSRAVGGREALFREDLYGVLNSPRLVKSRAGYVLRERGASKTDADAVIYDPSTGVMALFQLKWHDAFGSSMHERANKLKNMAPVADRWVDTVIVWLSRNSPTQILASMGIKKTAAPYGVTKVLLFVLGRNFSHFSGDKAPDERAAWGSWLQVQHVLREDNNSADMVADPLSHLHALIVRTSPILLDKPQMRERRMEFRGITLVIHSPHEQ